MSGKEKELISAYAKAFYEGLVEQAVNGLSTAASRLQADSQLALALSEPDKDLAALQPLLQKLLPEDAGPAVTNLVSLLASKRQLDLLAPIGKEVKRLAFVQGEQPVLVEVTSAVSLSDQACSDLEAKLRDVFGRGLQFHYQVDKSLIGGLVVRVGDKLIDHSVAGRLRSLQEELQAVVA